MFSRIRLGTRGSELAIKQAEIVRARLLALHPDISVDIVPISTQGDRDKKSPMSAIGGKGVFVKEVEQALINGEADIAVHSFKDLTSKPDQRLVLSGVLKPESNQDVVVLNGYSSLSELPEGAVIATGSLRRHALFRRYYPHLEIEPIRGNVATRITIMKQEGYAGVVLSYAGLIRLGIDDENVQVLDTKRFVPAPGQGVIALQCHRDNAALLKLCQSVSDASQLPISQVEFGLLSALDFNCQLPLGVNVRLDDDQLISSVFIATPDLDRQADFEFRSEPGEPVHNYVSRVSGVVKGWLEANSDA